MMKEIAEALREAGNEVMTTASQKKYYALAAKVEQMRCETCHWYRNTIKYEWVTWCYLNHVCGQGKNFYCNHWKEKVKDEQEKAD